MQVDQHNFNTNLGLILIESVKLRYNLIELLNLSHKERGYLFTIKSTGGTKARNISIDCLILDRFILENKEVKHKKIYDQYVDYCAIFDSYYFKYKIKGNK